jgi:hypothetical protein
MLEIIFMNIMYSNDYSICCTVALFLGMRAQSSWERETLAKSIEESPPRKFLSLVVVRGQVEVMEDYPHHFY